jgi:CO/xanthine dehydrogenase FAD-binding subunit
MILHPPRYERPNTPEAALALRASGEWTPLAGGTDYFPAHVGRACTESILDLSNVQAWRGISEHADHWRIGALTTWTDLVRTPLPALFDGLKRASLQVGGEQIQNRGTLGGNLCNASPAADGIPPLLALNAWVEASTSRGVSAIPLAEFVTAPRCTVCAADALVSAIIVPKPNYTARSVFLKLGARKYLLISTVMVGVTLEMDRNRLHSARVAIGACSAVAQRLPSLETALVDAPPTTRLRDVVTLGHLQALQPIDDVRGTAAYRLHAALALTRRALDQLDPLS